MNAIIVERLSKSFGEKRVLEDFSCTFPLGACTTIMGPSGCGKTTLLRLLLGLETPDGGRILHRPPRASAVFQENRLFPTFSALANLAAVLPPRTDRGLLADHLAQLGLGDSLHTPAGTLSGGMQRRLAIARAVLAPGGLLVMDEPFTGLDGATKAQVMDYVQAHTAGRTLLLVTHDPAEAARLGAHTLTMLPLTPSKEDPTP